MASNLDIKIWSSFGSNTSSPLTLGGTNSAVASEAVRAAGLTMGADIGGSLGALDIKRMDVKTAISMSLMETYVTTGDLYELVADGYGGVEFVEVGGGGSNLNYYYSTQTTSFNNPISDVLVVGGKPLPEIQLKPFIDVLQSKEIYTQQTMFENCRAKDFYKYATIVYPDPQLDTQYNDGIDNLYNITNPYEKLIGYVHYKNPNLENRPDVKITWANESSIPVKLHPFIDSTGTNVSSAPNIPMGNIKEIYNYKLVDGEGTQICNNAKGAISSYTDGVKIPIDPKWRYITTRGTNIDNFIRVSAVYIIGMEIELLFYAPASQDTMHQEPNVGNTIIWASINRNQITTFKCEEGRHYAIAFDETKNPYVVFAKETRNDDPFAYGQGTKFRLDPVCTLARRAGISGELTGTVFPITKTSGMLVFDIWVVVDIETPSINIYDPDGQAHTIAEKFEYHIAPMTSIDKPAPIASAKSGFIDQSDSVKNADPTDQQDLSNTKLDQVMDVMQGSGMSVTWSFLDDTQVESAASRLFDLMNTQNSVETVYTCEPNATPQLGDGVMGGSVVNAIRYSYTDQGSYTISVTAGPMLTPTSIVSVDGGPTPMMVEDVGAKGTIIQSAGDNINFKVAINGYGERWAICTTPQILRVGDIVQCSVHNNPVEY